MWSETSALKNVEYQLSRADGYVLASLRIEPDRSLLLQTAADVRGHFRVGLARASSDRATITDATWKSRFSWERLPGSSVEARMTSGAKASGRFGKQDFAYLPDEDVYRCPAGEKLKYYYTHEEDGHKLRNYWTNACKTCPLKSKCTPSPQRRIKRWVHEDVLERAQARLDKNPNAMRTRRETVEHPFGTLKMRMGATHFLCVTLPKVATEMALCVLGYNLTRVLNIVGMKPLLAAVTT